jgi:hypothetical protein
MMFAFLNTPLTSFSLTAQMKMEILKTLHIFWKCLNIGLKRSTSLTELLIKNICDSILSNFSIKIIDISNQFQSDESNDQHQRRKLIYLNPFLNVNKLNENSFICLFYLSLIEFLNDLFAIGFTNDTTTTNSNSYFEIFNQFLFLTMINSIIKQEKATRHQAKVSLLKEQKETFKNYSSQILNSIEIFIRKSSQVSLFKTEKNCDQLFKTLRLCVNFDLLKDSFTMNDFSQVEKYLLTYMLFKQCDQFSLDLNSLNSNNNNNNNNCKIASSLSNCSDLKRKIKMYLLEELYVLHKMERNYLHMSFIRKEQVCIIILLIKIVVIIIIKILKQRPTFSNGIIIEKALRNRISKKYFT